MCAGCIRCCSLSGITFWLNSTWEHKERDRRRREPVSDSLRPRRGPRRCDESLSAVVGVVSSLVDLGVPPAVLLLMLAVVLGVKRSASLMSNCKLSSASSTTAGASTISVPRALYLFLLQRVRRKSYSLSLSSLQGVVGGGSGMHALSRLCRLLGLAVPLSDCPRSFAPLLNKSKA